RSHTPLFPYTTLFRSVPPGLRAAQSPASGVAASCSGAGPHGQNEAHRPRPEIAATNGAQSRAADGVGRQHLSYAIHINTTQIMDWKESIKTRILGFSVKPHLKRHPPWKPRPSRSTRAAKTSPKA